MSDFTVTGTFVASANAEQLQAETRTRPEWPASFVQGTSGWVYRIDHELTSAERSSVQAALDAHVPNPTFGWSAEQHNEITINDRLIVGYDAMKAHVDRGTFTAAQRDAALLLVLRVCMGLIRIALRRLDATD